jgi:hypothetical protein
VSAQGWRWYLDRLRRMTPSEVLWRALNQARSAYWVAMASSGVMKRAPKMSALAGQNVPGLPDDPLLPDEAEAALLASACELLFGQWELLGVPRPDIASPDWFHDVVTGRDAPADQLSFRINHRDEQVTGNVKQIWELSRHHHITVLAAAYHSSGDDQFAKVAAEQLQSWWRENPVLCGVNWTSGIELGVRLISWVWTRRLLADWSGVKELFDTNPLFARQLYWHQRWLASFRSRGSSANNHVIAEAAGQLVAAHAFPWFEESERWARTAARLLEKQLRANTFASGINRELASDYHAFSAELALVAAAEADAAGKPLSDAFHELLCRIIDAAAALEDRSGRPPRQGDGDDGRALLLDDPAQSSWEAVLAIGAACYGPPPWRPAARTSVGAGYLGALLRPRRIPGRPETRPDHFADAGITLLRSRPEAPSELWCRCDGGPHGFGGIAGHAHADALAVEVRIDGVDILADPGTYCYHGEPEWRAYFRSTRAHNTLEVNGMSSSVEAGPFLWTKHAKCRETSVELAGPTAVWSAQHTGYKRLEPSVVHRRTVRLQRESMTLDILDVADVSSREDGVDLRLSYHLGPAVEVVLDGRAAHLSWMTEAGERTATLMLPQQLLWSAVQGSHQPVLGWYSPSFGERIPSTTLVGLGINRSAVTLRTSLRVHGMP